MENITLRDLRGLVGATKGQALPTARALREDGVPVVARANGADGALTVYENGFFTYATPVGTTVYAVDRCANYSYNGGDVLAEGLFEDEVWAVRLLLEGEDRLEHNNDAREQGSHYSYSADGVERGDLRDPHDFVADLENLDLVARMMGCLTEKQRRVMRLFFGEGMTQEEIQKQLGLSRGSFLDRLNGAIKKLKKLFT